jgi:hypothetical protein
MGRDLLRTWQVFDVEEVAKHLLILGDLTGDCAACRQLGISYLEGRECPQCKTPFKYVTSRRLETHPGERFQIVSRLREKRPDLIFLDYEDYKRTLGRKKAREFFER